MEYIGYVLFSLLFFYSSYSHLKNHSKMAGFAATAFGECPYAVQLGYLGGWPAGIYLGATGVLVALGTSLGFYAAAAFLTVATALYHRDFSDPGTWKNISLIGASLALATLV